MVIEFFRKKVLRRLSYLLTHFPHLSNNILIRICAFARVMKFTDSRDILRRMNGSIFIWKSAHHYAN